MTTRSTISPTKTQVEQIKQQEDKARSKRENEKLECEAKGGRWDEATQTCILPTDPNFIPDVNFQDVLKENKTDKEQLECQAKGGVWNADTRTCTFPQAPEEDPQVPETFRNEEGSLSGVTLPDGRTFLGLSPDEVRRLISGEQARLAQPLGTVPAGTSARVRREVAAGEAFAQQAGRFQELPVQETNLSESQSAIVAARESIPSAIRTTANLLFGSQALSKAIGSGTAAAGTGALKSPLGKLGGAAVALGAINFGAGFVSSLQNEMKAQRVDNTQQQKRVLDEGKQVLSDWVAYAKANPNDKATALAGFNLQLAQIDQAHRQMKIDTLGDQLKFETAIPDLAEFGAFYNIGGERDNLVIEMRQALATPTSSDWGMLEAASRRFEE